MPAARVAVALFALSLFAAPAVGASGTSHVLLWQTATGSVSCGVKIHAPGKRPTKIICAGTGIQRPKRPKHGVGDPFVQIAAHGRPRIVLISQNSFVGKGKPPVLPTGAHWSRLGVKCSVALATVTCKNKSKHGFTSGNGTYKAF
jgi:hypothetical protein